MTKEQLDSKETALDKEIVADSVVNDGKGDALNAQTASVEASPEILKAAQELKTVEVADAASNAAEAYASSNASSSEAHAANGAGATSGDGAAPGSASNNATGGEQQAKPFEVGPTIKPIRERIAVVIPCYNHGTLIEPVIKRVLEYGLTCIVVDDGSSQGSVTALKELQSRYEGIYVLYHLQNSGKGGAVLSGLRLANELGFSHILQVDADGQHNLDDLPKFFALNAKYPKAVISGSPIFSEDAPKGRVYGRRITNFWVMVETLSTGIKESMCGYRIYPIKQLMALYDRDVLPRAMDFDISAIVQLYWDGLDILFVDTKVRYLINGHSNFRMVHDNVKISLMHTGLVFNTLLHLPSRILDKMRRNEEYSTKGKRMESFVKAVNEAQVDDDGNLIFKNPTEDMPLGSFAVPRTKRADGDSSASASSLASASSTSSAPESFSSYSSAAASASSSGSDAQGDSAEAWNKQQEQKGAMLGLKTVVFIQKILGKKLSSYLVYPVVGCYWLVDKKRRTFSADFLEVIKDRREGIMVKEAEGKHHLISSQWSREPLTTYRHFVHFGSSMIDRLNAWRDEVKLGDDIFFAPGAEELLKNYHGKGCFIITSHLGNMDMARALISKPLSNGKLKTLNALVYEQNAAGFVSVMEELAPRSRFNLISLDHVGPDTAIKIKSKLDNNEWVAIAADRVSVSHNEKSNNRIRHIDFLGKPAPFGEGPFILATLMQVDVIQLFAIKDQDKIFIHAYKLADAKKVERSERDSHISVMMERYVHHLELQAINYPLEWFNFYDFWNADKTK